MIRHAVEVCPDDLEALRNKLDELARTGSRIITVLWEPRRLTGDQTEAYEARGGFVIISQREATDA